MNHTELPWKHTARSNLKVLLRGTCGGHGDIRLLPQDPGPGRRRRTSTETAAPLPSPAGGAEEDTQADPLPFSPRFPPAATLPPLSFFLSACTAAVYWTGPQWPWVINGDYGADCSVSSSAQLSAAPLLCLSPLSHDTAGAQKKTRRSPLQAAPNCCTTMEGAYSAVREH